MNTPLRTAPLGPARSRLAGTVSVVFTFAALSAPAPAALMLQLADGSSVTVDRLLSADDSSLTVAAFRETGHATRSLPWPRIASATLDGERYSPRELRLALGLPVDERSARQGDASFSAPPLVLPCPPPFPIPDFPFPTPPPGRVISIQPDPLSAYADLAPSIYPAGIPTTEAPFARAVLRERRRLEAVAPFASSPFASPPFAVPPPWPVPTTAPAVLPLPPAEAHPLIGP